MLLSHFDIERLIACSRTRVFNKCTEGSIGLFRPKTFNAQHSALNSQGILNAHFLNIQGGRKKVWNSEIQDADFLFRLAVAILFDIIAINSSFSFVTASRPLIIFLAMIILKQIRVSFNSLSPIFIL